MIIKVASNPTTINSQGKARAQSSQLKIKNKLGL